MLPQENATITAVGATGGAADTSSDAWDDAEAAAAQASAGGPSGVWEGGGRAYYQEKRVRARTGEDERLLVQRSLIVAEGDPPVAWASEQAVTFQLDGAAAPEVGTVRHVERRVLPSAGGAQTTRLTLEDV